MVVFNADLEALCLNQGVLAKIRLRIGALVWAWFPVEPQFKEKSEGSSIGTFAKIGGAELPDMDTLHSTQRLEFPKGLENVS